MEKLIKGSKRMKVAMCFSGQVRTLDKCIESIKRNVINKIPEKPDIFCHFYESELENEKTIVKELLSPQLCIFDSEKKIQIDLLEKCYANRCIKKGPRTREGVERVLRQLYSVFCSNNLKKQYEQKNSFQYDIVFRIRADQLYHNDLEDLDIVGENEIYVPAHDWHGGINDRFSFAKSETMNKYANMWNEIEILNTLGSFHPETLALNVCKRNNIKIIKSKITCNRVREDGTVIPLY